MKLIFTLLTLLSLNSGISFAEKLPPIQLNAILKNAAVITVSGQQQMLKKNSTSREGFKLIRIESDSITLEKNGKQYRIKPGAAISSTQSSAKERAVTINRDNRGMFHVEGTINDYPVNFLVDTGATFVALNSNVAKKIGIDYLRRGIPTLGNTASGVVKTYKLQLNNIKVGGIQLYKVDAVVIEGNFPVTTLLGMSFLQRVTMRDEGQFLTLLQK